MLVILVVSSLTAIVVDARHIGTGDENTNRGNGGSDSGFGFIGAPGVYSDAHGLNGALPNGGPGNDVSIGTAGWPGNGGAGNTNGDTLS